MIPRRQDGPRTTINIKNKWLIKADERADFRNLFDLYEIRDVEEYISKDGRITKTGKIVKKECEIGLSYLLHNALDMVVRMETSDAINGKEVSLQEYMKELRKQKEDIYDKLKLD